MVVQLYLELQGSIESLELTSGEEFGAKIVARACEEPLRQIAGNAGLDGAIVIDRVINGKGKTFGFNALTEEYADLLY